jgi:hypothetical protein
MRVDVLCVGACGYDNLVIVVGCIDRSLDSWIVCWNTPRRC